MPLSPATHPLPLLKALNPCIRVASLTGPDNRSEDP